MGGFEWNFFVVYGTHNYTIALHSDESWSEFFETFQHICRNRDSLHPFWIGKKFAIILIENFSFGIMRSVSFHPQPRHQKPFDTPSIRIQLIISHDTPPRNFLSARVIVLKRSSSQFFSSGSSSRNYMLDAFSCSHIASFNVFSLVGVSIKFYALFITISR